MRITAGVARRAALRNLLTYSASLLVLCSSALLQAQTPSDENENETPPADDEPPPRAKPRASQRRAPPPEASGNPAYPGYPPGYYGTPPGYPPPGYAPPGYYPYGYGYYRPPVLPREYRYVEGQPVPPGFVLEERVRKGPIIAGSIVFGVPYTLGLLAGSASDFSNEGGWLVVPVLGPWLTLIAREGCHDRNDYLDDSDCRVVRTFLIMDGLMQTAGAALFVWGVSSPRKWLVRTDAWLPTPSRVGTGYGLASRVSF